MKECHHCCSNSPQDAVFCINCGNKFEAFVNTVTGPTVKLNSNYQTRTTMSGDRDNCTFVIVASGVGSDFFGFIEYGLEYGSYYNYHSSPFLKPSD